MKMFTRSFWILASERALKTVAQTFLALAAAVGVFDALQADWQTMLGVSIGAGLLSYATSIVSAEIGTSADPSLVKTQPGWAEEAPDEIEVEEDE
jgi:hypothetical protein